MSSEQIPLGQPEDQRLEFKSRDALQDRFNIGRVVVGMLNGEGGDIWIGLAEENERAVRIESIEKPETEKRMLEDFLVDTIEPPLSSEDFKIYIVPTPQDEHLLKIQVQPDEGRQPYALLRKNLRDYVLRVGGRLRPMSREEIFRRVSTAARRKDDPRKALDAAVKRVQDAREQVERFPKGTFWLNFQPIEKLSIEVQDPVFHDLAMTPSLTGNRRVGYNFARANDVPELAKDRLSWAERYPGFPEGDMFEVTVQRSGTLTFRAALKNFTWKGETHQLLPSILVEYPTSAFRIASFIYRKWEASPRPVVVECTVLDIKDWELPAGDFEWGVDQPHRYEEAQDLIWEEPLVFRMDEIQEEPDRCSFRLLRRIYEAFGYRESAIPFFDRDTGRLVLPE